MKAQSMILVRGLPGSGKTTFAKYIADNNTVVVAADDWMVDENGNYKFDAQRLQECHDNCFNMATSSLLAGKSVIVHNTFTRLREMNSYIQMALANGIPYFVVKMTTQYVSVHNVPEHSIAAMKNRWED